MQPLNNLVILRGNLGKDPELRRTKRDNTPVCNFDLATNEFYVDTDGKRQKRTEWHKITAWGKCAEQCGKALEMGREVTIMGKLVTRKWTDTQGVNRTTTEIHTQNVEFGRHPTDGDDQLGEFDEDNEAFVEDTI